MKTSGWLIVLAIVMAVETPLHGQQVGEKIVITNSTAWRTAKQDSPGSTYHDTGDGNFLADSYKGQQATIVAVQSRGRELLDVVAKFDDGALAITSGSRVPVPAEFPIKRGFKTLDEVAIENAAAAKREEEHQKNAGVRIWHDTHANVVRAGTTGSWFVTCEDDRIDDERRCLMRPYGFVLMVVIVTKNGAILGIGANNFPGSEISIRIDTEPAVKWTEGALTTERLRAQRQAISQMVTGRTYLARSYGWPNRDVRKVEGSLDGFKEAFEWAQSAVKAYPGVAIMPAFKLDSSSETPGGLPVRQ